MGKQYICCSTDCPFEDQGMRLGIHKGPRRKKLHMIQAILFVERNFWTQEVYTMVSVQGMERWSDTYVTLLSNQILAILAQETTSGLKNQIFSMTIGSIKKCFGCQVFKLGLLWSPSWVARIHVRANSKRKRTLGICSTRRWLVSHSWFIPTNTCLNRCWIGIY